MEGFEVGVRRVTEIRTPSLGYRIQRSRAKKESQEAHWSEFRSASINNKPKRKSVTFSNVISNDKSRTSPSAEIYSLHMGNGRDGEEKDKPACSNKEETIVISEMKETVQFPTGHENQEVGMTSNKFADSLPACMDVPQDNWGVTERFDIAGQMKPIELDKPIKSDTPDFQTIWDQASTVDIQTKPLKDLQNENIQNVTMKRLREIRFSPTTFKRRNLSASDLTEQISFSRIVSKGAECRAEDIPMLPDNQRHKLHMEPHESYHIDLTAQENAETRDKRECSKEKVEERRKLHYHYEVKEEIGRGSYSFVKRVVNKQNGTHCAAKCITLRRGIKAYEELAILCKLNHSKIACLLDKFETKRTLVLVLEMCSNEGLLDHLLKKNIVAEAKVRNYIQQILEGVLYLHNNNILHLDIKPANILMVHPERDDIKICDFGFAQELLLDKLQFSEYGCPEFVAPEIVSQDPISTATDIWSIGVITFLCLTGNCPFSGENDRITLLNVKEGRFSWNEHDLDCTTENARSFVRRIIKLIPKDRPTASECLNDRWFQEKQKVQQFCTINTKRLKLYLSRNKWQRSLMCYKSILVKRSIPQLFEEPSKIHSLGMPQHLLKQSSSTTSSASSSDFEDCGQQTEPSSYHASVISQRPAPFPTDILDIAASEHRSQRSVLTGIIAVEKQTDVRDQTSGKSDDVKVQCNSPEIFKGLNLSTKRIKYSIVKAASVEISDFSRMEMVVTHKLTRAISADSVLTPQVLTKDALLDSNAKPPSRLLPRHCLIGRESVIRKPLLDYFPMGAQESIAKDKRFDESLSHSSRELYKTASCDTVHRAAYVPKEKLRKSKSLDEYGTESVVQTTRESASELINSCFQSSDLDSNAKATGRPMVTLPFSIDEQVLGTQKSALSDTMCLSEGVTFYTDVLQYPTKGTSSEMDQSLQTLESLEKEQSMDTEDKAYATDIKDYNSKGNSSALPSLQHSLDLQNKHQELSQSIQDIETSCNSKLSELKTKTEKVQNDEEPINLYSNVSGISSLDSKVSTDSELHKKNSAASVDAAEPQTQSSSKNVSSLYYDAAETDANYFDLLEPNNSRELHYEHGPLCLAHEFKEKSTSQVKSLPEPCTSEEPSSSRETDVSKDNPPRAKSNRSSTTSYELLCNETEPVSENLCGLIAAEWESDLLELLEGSEEDEIMSEFEEGESKSKKKSKRISLESKIYQSFISLKKAFKGQQDARAPISSSKTSLIVGESHNDPGLKSTSKTFGTSGLLKLLNRSASLNWDKDFQDGDRGGSRHSLSAFLGGGKSQTLPARFSWQSLKSKDSAERPELRKKQQELSKVQRRASSSGMESADNQYMEFMKVPLIPSFTQHHTDSEKQQASMCSTDTSDNAIGSLKIKSRLFSFKIPGSKSKEKAPSFLEELQDQSVVLSQTVTLSCRTSGYPNPKIHWFKDNQLMCRSDRILSSTTSTKCQLLTILNVGEEDLGNYKCVAENHLDKASTCCLLNLADLPCCPDSPEVVQVFEDGALVIWKPLVSSMPVTYVIECQKKGKGWQTIASDLSENCFYPSNLSRGDAYLYRIAYVNKAGTGPFSHPSAEIIIGETEIQSHSLHGEMPASLQETYTFLAEISRGRFSIIKKCVENSTGKLLASKITRYKKKKKPFVLKEYETLKKLHHCNIVQLHGAYITPKYFVLIQELCRGKELFHYLAERSCYSEHHVVELLAQILGAVEYLHLNQILHLDLRSENMIIVEHNILKLLDFGNAEIHMPGRPVLVEKFSDFVENMAPEILERKAAVRETDIWAVGVVTFTMLSGDCPFRSDKDYDKEKNIRKGKIKYGRCYAGLSQGAVSFLKNTLCLNPGGRMCASECRSFSWLQEETKMKLTSSTVSFQTAKLRNFLKQQEKQRMLLCTKHKVLIVQ